MMFVENGNQENKENFYQDIITKFPKDTQKKILSEIIKKLKEDIKESNNIFFYSNEIVNEIEDKFNFFQGPLNYIQDLNNSSNGNPLSKGQFVSSGTNQINSDIYINEEPNNNNNEYTDSGIQFCDTEKKTNFDTMSIEGNDENECVDELLYSFKDFVNKKNDEQKKQIMFDFIDFVFQN